MTQIKIETNVFKLKAAEPVCCQVFHTTPRLASVDLCGDIPAMFYIKLKLRDVYLLLAKVLQVTYMLSIA
jgi:hypothetical protein